MPKAAESASLDAAGVAARGKVPLGAGGGTEPAEGAAGPPGGCMDSAVEVYLSSGTAAADDGAGSAASGDAPGSAPPQADKTAQMTRSWCDMQAFKFSPLSAAAKLLPAVRTLYLTPERAVSNDRREPCATTPPAVSWNWSGSTSAWRRTAVRCT
jgi:hypothetical protein